MFSLAGGGGEFEENDDSSIELSNALDPPKCENSTGPLKLASPSLDSSNEENPEGFLLVLSELNPLLLFELWYDSNDPKEVDWVTPELDSKLFPVFKLSNELNDPKFDGCCSSESELYPFLLSLSLKAWKELNGGSVEISELSALAL